MPNYNDKTGIPFGVVSLNSLADWVWDEFSDNGRDLTSEAIEAEARAELGLKPDDDLPDDFWDGVEVDEREYELDTTDDNGNPLKLSLSYLGGAALVWVHESAYLSEVSPCSPCVPGAGDLDNKRTGGMECYDLPPDWYAKDEV